MGTCVKREVVEGSPSRKSAQEKPVKRPGASPHSGRPRLAVEAVQIGSALVTEGPSIFARLGREMRIARGERP